MCCALYIEDGDDDGPKYYIYTCFVCVIKVPYTKYYLQSDQNFPGLPTICNSMLYTYEMDRKSRIIL